MVFFLPLSPPLPPAPTVTDKFPQYDWVVVLWPFPHPTEEAHERLYDVERALPIK